MYEVVRLECDNFCGESMKLMLLRMFVKYEVKLRGISYFDILM